MGRVAAVTPTALGPGSGRIVSVDPATLEVLGEVEARSAGWVDAACARARLAQRAWAAAGLAKRVEALERLKRAILDDADAVAALVARETGRTFSGAMASEVFPVVDLIAYFCKHAPALLAPESVPIRHWRLFGRRSYLASPPIGLVGVISPWNFPFFLSMGSVVMGLLTGNAVILKPSEVTPLVGERIAALAERAGIPADVLVVASGEGETGRAVVERVDKVFFIGSDQTARRILAACAPRLTPCVMELGGNAPALVLADAHLENAARGIAWGAFFNAGQICASVQRVYVDKAHYERFRDLLIAEARALRLSADRRATDVSALTCDAQLAHVERMVEEARAAGARVLTGGRRAEGLAGLFYEPTVLEGVEQTARFAQDEVFGPVCMVAPFGDEEEALRLANDTRFGLTASVWTRDVRRGARLAERIEAGSVTVNDHAITAGMAEAPWGGHKQSGFGVIHSRYGLYEFVARRHVHVNRLPGTALPWWFPENPKLELAMKRLGIAMAGDGLWRRAVAFKDAARGFMAADRERRGK